MLRQYDARKPERIRKNIAHNQREKLHSAVTGIEYEGWQGLNEYHRTSFHSLPASALATTRLANLGSFQGFTRKHLRNDEQTCRARSRYGNRNRGRGAKDALK
jgi:hypothetical protein